MSDNQIEKFIDQIQNKRFVSVHSSSFCYGNIHYGYEWPLISAEEAEAVKKIIDRVQCLVDPYRNDINIKSMRRKFYLKTRSSTYLYKNDNEKHLKLSLKMIETIKDHVHDDHVNEEGQKIIEEINSLLVLFKLAY